MNVGAAGGQTVPHLHVHVIPRYAGDVANPRGGVRHVIPARADYLAVGPAKTGTTPRLITLVAAFEHDAADRLTSPRSGGGVVT